MISAILSSGQRTASLLKASPKGEGFQPSPSETLNLERLRNWRARDSRRFLVMKSHQHGTSKEGVFYTAVTVVSGQVEPATHAPSLRQVRRP